MACLSTTANRNTKKAIALAIGNFVPNTDLGYCGCDSAFPLPTGPVNRQAGQGGGGGRSANELAQVLICMVGKVASCAPCLDPKTGGLG